jgi:exopolyphosphatase/guanosine-5'-triphosphate,3'-diphosphate pyrophosphatase
MSISRAEYCKQVDAIRSMSIESSARRFNIPITEAEGFVPGNIVYRLFLESTAADAVIVPFTNIREGILLDRVIGADTELQNEFAYQTIASAVNLGRKYHFDEPHSKHVAALTVTIFDALEKEHGMTARHRMILETAAILHDIGIFIRTSGHQKHGQYLVAHSEIFGLHPEEQAIAANVVGYHRGTPPSEADFDYIALQREERILVLKMASILRVADALDRSHRQRIKTITLERLEETVVIHTDAPLDLTTERIAVEEKAAMFQDVFGYKVILE